MGLRSISRVVITVILCLFAWSTVEAARPNFLFILADDVTYNDLGCYGGENVKTPNIDRLASEGIRFRRTHCAMSMCAPFRA